MTQWQQTGPSKKGVWIGVILIVIGIVGGLGLIGYGAKRLVDTVNGYQRVDARRGGTVRFTKTGKYYAYFERAGIDQPRDIPPIQILLNGPGGAQTLEVNSTTTEHYDFNDHEGVRITKFNIATPGQYQVRVVGESGVVPLDEIAFGRGTITAGILGVAGGLLGGGLIVFIGAIVLITTLVRRGRYRRRMAQAGYGAPGYGGPGVWPPPGPTPAGPWHPETGQQPGPAGQPQTWAPTPPPPSQSPPPPPPAWSPPPQAPQPPPAPPASGPTSDPDRPGWGGPGQ